MTTRKPRPPELDMMLQSIDDMREKTTRDYQRAMHKLDNDERWLLGLKPLAYGVSANAKEDVK